MRSESIVDINSFRSNKKITLSTPLQEISPKFDGPLSKEMWKKVSDLNSAYPDSFDWSVYDRLYAKYSENMPRGGVVFKTNLKLVNHHSSCTKCHYAFEIDSYGRGCVHDCVYCYAKELLSGYGYWNRPQPFPLDLSEIRKIFYTVFETTKSSKWRSILEKKIPLRIGSMSDSFMWMDKRLKVTQELLKILNFYEYPHIVFTRSDLIAHDEYLKIMNRDLISIQFSLSGDNEVLSKKLEPGAPTVSRRLNALKKLNESGFWTAVRVNPMFPIFPDGYFTDKQSVVSRFGSLKNVPQLDLMSWELPYKLAEAKVPSVLAGFVRLSPFAINAISRALDIDFNLFFKPEVTVGSEDRHFSDSEIAYYYLKFKTESAKAGLRFNTCYIGNGEKDYYQYQSLWDNKSDCCDTRGNLKSFSSSSQDIEWSERAKHAPCKTRIQENMKQEQKTAQEYAGKNHDLALPTQPSL